MKNDDNYKLIIPLISRLKENGIQLTDKVIQSLAIAAKDAKQLKYRNIYDDNILTGLIKSQSSITKLFSDLNINIDKLLDDVHFGDTDLKYDYRRDYSNKSNQRKLRRQHKKPFDQIGDPESYVGGRDVLPKQMNNLRGNVSTEDLFLSLLNMPIVWYNVNKQGLSINKIKRIINSINKIEPDIETQKYVLSYDGDNYRFNSFDLIDAYSIKAFEYEFDKGLYPVKENIINPKQYFLKQQIEEFEWLINKSKISEYDIQKFLENNSEFLLGIEYKNLHSKLVLTRDDNSKLIPDFFLERIDGVFCDIAELKVPTAKIMVGKPNRRTFSSAIISALGQLREYRNYFDNPSNRKAFYNRYGLQAYKPTNYIIIGRSSDFHSHYERADLEEYFPRLKLITYDDILNKAKKRLELIS